ncbi:MAG: hypothetical protein LIR46_01380 [Bacteroidota bacterium]|nr:hypothetical protein [Bacteroidota bacterium]
MWTTYWWMFVDEDSALCGEEFFTELENATFADHKAMVKDLFPDENPRCLGEVTQEEAEEMGLDTY